MIELIIAAAIAATDYKATTSIAVQSVPSIPLAAKPHSIVAVASNAAPISYETKTPTVCAAPQGVVIPKVAGLCVLIAKTAATPSHVAGRTPFEFAITAVLSPPPIDPEARGIKIVAVTPTPVNQSMKITATAAGKTDWVDFYADGARLGRINAAPYDWLYTPARTGAIKINVEASILGPNGAGYFGADFILEVTTESAPPPPPPPWTAQEKFFAACGPCPSTGKVETQSCPDYKIGLIDLSAGAISQNMKWVKK